MVRRYQQGEEDAIWNLFFNTTRKVNSRDYTPAQINRWAPEGRDPMEWAMRLQRTNPFVAIESGEIVGFAELESDGHIDCFYCHHDWQRRRVGRTLFHTVEAEANALGLRELYAEVSTTAEPFFTAMGFRIEEERTPIICGSPAKQFLMRKGIGT